MGNNLLRVLVLGDVIGQPGCRALFTGLKQLTKKTGCQLVIVNGENAAQGFGITPALVNDFFQYGVDVITSGNHIWRQQEIYSLLETEDKLLRPQNYPDSVPGKGYCTITIRDHSIGVINLQGRLQMYNIRCPFRVAKTTIKELRKKCKVIIIDFHAESPAEKEALGIYLDGEISALIGTHTHVPTADEKILPQGTAYITDIGMTGPIDSVIGIKPEIAIRRSLTQIPIKMEIAETSAEINGILLEINLQTGKALSIKRIKQRALV